MAVLVTRLREIIASEVDDFFADDTLAYYITQSKQQLVNTAIRLEREQNRSFRVLDKLRRNASLPLTGATYDFTTYYTTSISLASIDLLDLFDVRYGDNTPLKEISFHTMYDLTNGFIIPTKYEGYYNLLNDGTNDVIELYLHEEKDTESLLLRYVKNVSAIGTTDETLGDLPERLLNACLYGAAVMAVTSEDVTEADPKPIKAIYNDEMKLNLY